MVDAIDGVLDDQYAHPRLNVRRTILDEAADNIWGDIQIDLCITSAVARPIETDQNGPARTGADAVPRSMTAGVLDRPGLALKTTSAQRVSANSRSEDSAVVGDCC